MPTRPFFRLAFLPALLGLICAAPVQAQLPRLPGAGLVAAADWQNLSPGQRAALQPLQNLWPSMSLEQQREWVALVENFSRLSAQEQGVLQSRMREWARLSPQQRAQARLNFGEARDVPADEKRAKWQAYQALPPEQRRLLANENPESAARAAPALHPAPAKAAGKDTLPLPVSN